MAKSVKRILVLAVIFTMTIVNYGLPLQAIAAESGSIFNFAFFRKNEIALEAYFDEDTEKEEEIKNVNDTAKITLEVSPLIEGYLKSGSLKFNLKNGNENNFKLETATIEQKEELELDETDTLMLEEAKDIKPEEKEESEVSGEVLENAEVEQEAEKVEEKTEETEKENDEEKKNDDKNSLLDALKGSSVKEVAENIVSKATAEASEDTKVEKEEPEADEILEEPEKEVDKEPQKTESLEETEKSDGEENVEELEERDIVEEAKECYEVSLSSENEIALKNIIDTTKIFVEVSYKHAEKIKPEDLLSEIEIVLEGDYINKKLETLEINKKQELTLGWEYSKEVKVKSEIEKVSPFTVGKNTGTIIENVITVEREIEENKFLPIKETNIKIEIPKINDKLPIAVNVAANKLMATLGKELTGKEFTKDNWTYDEEKGILEIRVVNEENLVGSGEDKFDIICRYEDYYEAEKITLDKKVEVKVEEYSAKENKIQEAKIEESQEKEVVAGELMSYAILENEETIGKGRINANYHIGAGETRFSSKLNVTVLTSDILDEVVIEPVKETYKTKDGVELDASIDVKYVGVKFNLAEIKEMLGQGTTIDLLDGEGNVFHTITNEVDATKIEFANEIDNLKVRINDVKVNGNLSVEFVKSIERSQYTAAEFAVVESIENSYKAEVKYVGFEDIFQLPEVKDEIKFANTITQVNLLMNKSQLSTIYENDNVEFKIDLINNLETSDIYKNPSFELVFPVFVKEVKLNNIYTLYQNGLSIKDYQVVNENGRNKIIINLEGVQNGYNFSDITNGTNIIINTNLVLDDITPQKQDQVELYYCNEAVTNYQTQADWKISKVVPEGILSDKNGYDATGFTYQAPSGMLVINSMTNYDGTGETIKSFNQGEIIKVVQTKGAAQIATMDLTVVNNTDNEFKDAVLLGRIPFKGNKDVETGEDLGTNVDTLMKSLIIPEEINTNETTIYYSSNPNADKDLNKETNGWNTSFSPVENIKSFMIVVNGTVEKGAILKFKYNFEIPANLGYDVKILGSFGAFYNEEIENLVKKGSTIADKVGIVTGSGVKYETTMSVNIGEEAEIGEAKELIYTVKVTNTGSIDLNNIRIENEPIKLGSIQNAEEMVMGKGIYHIDKLAVGETKEKEILVKTANIPEDLRTYVMTLSNMYEDIDENGNVIFYVLDENNQKKYITELPKEFYIENYATVYVEDTVNGIKTNTVKNKLKSSYLDITVDVFNTVGDLNPGEEFKYIIDVYNISDTTINNIIVEDLLPKELTYLRMEQDNTDYIEEFDKENNKLKVSVGSLEPLETARFFVFCEVSTKNIGKTTISNTVTVIADNNIKENGNVAYSTLLGPELTVTQETNAESNSVLEMDKFQILVNINNKGEADSQTIDLNMEIPEIIEIMDITSEGKRMINYTTEGNTIIGNLYLLGPHDTASLVITARCNPLNEGETNRILDIKTQVSENYIGKLEINPLEIIVLDNPERELTEEEKKAEDEKVTIVNPEAGDDYKQDIEENTNNTNDTNDTSNTDNNNNEKTEDNNNLETTEPIEDNDSVEMIRTYKVTGKVWEDANKNNAKDSNEDGIGKVQVSLYKENSKLKSVVTDSLGKYRFTEIEPGDYTIAFEYDGKEYIAAKYKLANVVESENSDAIESEEGLAVTDIINIIDKDVEIDLGLQDRDVLDFAVQKYITKAIITTNGKEKVENYDSKELAKLEIRSKELKNTSIALEYKIVITNMGTVSGIVGEVYDYLPDSLSFNEKDNTGWEMQSKDVLVNKTLKDTVIKAGETKELKLVLTKKMTEDNTGTISNKVQIAEVSSEKGSNENTENNIATQEIIITISTGRTVSRVLFVIVIISTTLVIYGIRTGKIKRKYK